MNGRILVVDDEPEIADLVALYLTNEGYQVDTEYHGNSALKAIQDNKYSMAILDVMLPGIDGFALCREIRKTDNFPIIMLTAKGEDVDKLNGLALGADDYVTKPFRPLELVARVKAQLRRFTKYNHWKEGEELSISGLVLNRGSHECFLDEKPLVLTPREFSILWYLCENRGQVISAEQIFSEIWKEKYFTNSSNTVMVHIRHLREKMNDIGENPKYIKTVWGVGYKIEG